MREELNKQFERIKRRRRWFRLIEFKKRAPDLLRLTSHQLSPLVFSLDFLAPPPFFFLFPRLSHANVLRLDPPDRLADTIMYALRIHRRLNKKERRQNKKQKLMKAENNNQKKKGRKNRRARGGDEGPLPYSFYHASKKDFWGSFSCHRLKKVRLLIFDVKRQTGGGSKSLIPSGQNVTLHFLSPT